MSKASESKPGNDPAEPDVTTEENPEVVDETATAEASEGKPDADPVAEARAEAQRWEDQYLRARADLDNFRRRMQREREDALKYGAQPFLESLLPAFDNLELGLQSARQHHPEAKGVVDGLGMVLTQLQGVLGESGVAVIDPAGEVFDPNQHDAVSHENSGEVAENHVLRVIRKGYSLHGRLVRPASVVVSSGAAESVEASAGEESQS